MWQYDSYVHKLDSILEKLRAKYMGQGMRFVDMVPGGGKLPPDTLSKHVAQQLTAQLARVDQLSDKELFESYWWLRSVALYILLHVTEEDQTLRSLMRIASLSEGALDILTEKYLPPKYAEALPYVPEMVKENLEEVIWLRAEISADRLIKLEQSLP